MAAVYFTWYLSPTDSCGTFGIELIVPRLIVVNIPKVCMVSLNVFKDSTTIYDRDQCATVTFQISVLLRHFWFNNHPIWRRSRRVGPIGQQTPSLRQAQCWKIAPQYLVRRYRVMAYVDYLTSCGNSDAKIIKFGVGFVELKKLVWAAALAYPFWWAAGVQSYNATTARCIILSSSSLNVRVHAALYYLKFPQTN